MTPTTSFVARKIQLTQGAALNFCCQILIWTLTTSLATVMEAIRDAHFLSVAWAPARAELASSTEPAAAECAPLAHATLAMSVCD